MMFFIILKSACNRSKYKFYSNPFTTLPTAASERKQTPTMSNLRDNGPWCIRHVVGGKGRQLDAVPITQRLARNTYQK